MFVLCSSCRAVNDADTLSPSGLFVQLMDALCAVIAARSKGDAVSTPWILVIWQRMRWAGVRFAAAAAKFRAGTLVPQAPRAPRRSVVAAEPASPREAMVRQPKMLPCGVPDRLPAWLPRRAGWLAILAPEAASYSGWLHKVLSDPEVMAMAAASPQIARMLRSACWMLAVDPRPFLPAQPARPRKAVDKEPARRVRNVSRIGRPDYPEHFPPFPAGPDPRPQPKRRRGRPIARGWILSW